MPFGDVSGRVLIVDDDEATCRLYKHALEKSGIGAHYVQNARDAKEAIHNGDFGLALVDLILGLDDGAALADDLCASKPDLAIILMTGKDIAEIAVRSHHPIMEKPMKLYSVIERVIIHLTLRWVRTTLLKMDERIATYTMSNMIKEFFEDPRGKILCVVLGSVCAYAVTRGEGFVTRLEGLEKSSIESVTLLKRIQQEGKR